MERRNVIRIMQKAQEIADVKSGCKKVAVGSALYLPHYAGRMIFDVNQTLPVNCREVECQREELYGENSKIHRLPSDCRALHSEIAVIAQAARFGIPAKGATIIITRYPCEACARAIVRAGISKVYYGREQEISEQTAEIFNAADIEVEHISEFTSADTTL